MRMTKLTKEDFFDKRTIAFFATMPDWYPRFFEALNLDDASAGKVAKAIILTLTDRGNEVDINSLNEKENAAYLCAMTWLPDIKECAELADE